MSWIIQLDGENLTAVEQIDGLTEDQIKRSRFVLNGDHFDRDRVMGLLAEARIPRSKGAKQSAMAPVCDRIETALNPNSGGFGFDLFREISGWFATGPSKPGGDQLEKILRRLFYDQVFGRFTEQNNQRPVHNFRAIFLPWLKKVFEANLKKGV